MSYSRDGRSNSIFERAQLFDCPKKFTKVIRYHIYITNFLIVVVFTTQKCVSTIFEKRRTRSVFYSQSEYSLNFLKNKMAGIY